MAERIRVQIRALMVRSQILRPVGNNRGVALMLALATMSLIIFLAVEIMYDTTVEYNVNSQELNRLKAYYAARGAIEIGLLRIKIYQSVRSKFGAQVKNNPYIEQIWKFPLQWPLPTEMLGAVDKDEAKEKTAESLVDAQYTLDISDEGSKIDVNDLASPSKTLQDNAEKRLKELFEDKLQTDEEFHKEYANFRFDDLINQMKDWQSAKWGSATSGDKRGAFAEYQSQEIPPNRGFRTVGELRMLPLMDDRLFEFLEPRLTIYGLKGVNPNTATSEELQSLDSGITKEVAAEIIQERDKNPFADAGAFYGFVSGKSKQLKARSGDEWPLTFESMTSFRLKAHGQFAGASRTIDAVVMDIGRTSARIKEYVDKEKKDPNDQSNPGNTGQPGSQTQQQNQNKNQPDSLSKGPPRIVYWSEE